MPLTVSFSFFPSSFSLFPFYFSLIQPATHSERRFDKTRPIKISLIHPAIIQCRYWSLVSQFVPLATTLLVFGDHLLLKSAIVSLCMVEVVLSPMIYTFLTYATCDGIPYRYNIFFLSPCQSSCFSWHISQSTPLSPSFVMLWSQHSFFDIRLWKAFHLVNDMDIRQHCGTIVSLYLVNKKREKHTWW